MVTPESRVKEFRFERFSVVDNQLYCNSCAKFIKDYKDVDKIKAHCSGQKHTANKQRPFQNQTTIGSYSKEVLINDFIELLVSCNIPLDRSDKMRPFMF